MAKLNQVIAVEKGVKSRVFGSLSEIYKKFQKATLFSGMSRQYQKKDEEGEDYPSENTRVQASATQLLDDVKIAMSELLNITAQKDWANCHAKADIVVDGTVLLEQVPSTYLLFLEKQLNDLKDELAKIPELDPAHAWNFDAAANLYKADPTVTSKTRKVPKVIVKYDATEHHPAQTELIHTDEVVGTWKTVLQSGAMPPFQKKELQERVKKLIQAVKFAREEANGALAPKQEIAEALFSYLF